MPELARFYGISIRMFIELGERHHVPHFHAYHQESTAVFSFQSVALLVGALPQQQPRLGDATRLAGARSHFPRRGPTLEWPARRCLT